MTNKTYIYTIDHEAKTICLPPPELAGDIGSPPSWSLRARKYRFNNHFVGYSNSILTKDSWGEHIKTNEVLSINSDDMEKDNP